MMPCNNAIFIICLGELVDLWVCVIFVDQGSKRAGERMHTLMMLSNHLSTDD